MMSLTKNELKASGFLDLDWLGSMHEQVARLIHLEIVFGLLNMATVLVLKLLQTYNLHSTTCLLSPSHKFIPRYLYSTLERGNSVWWCIAVSYRQPTRSE
jgi:hypothetical protein